MDGRESFHRQLTETRSTMRFCGHTTSASINQHKWTAPIFAQRGGAAPALSFREFSHSSSAKFPIDFRCSGMSKPGPEKTHDNAAESFLLDREQIITFAKYALHFGETAASWSTQNSGTFELPSDEAETAEKCLCALWDLRFVSLLFLCLCTAFNAQVT